jgi:hypothetical protein
LLVSLLATGCANRPADEPASPHGSQTVRWALANKGFEWRTYRRPGLHIHYDARSALSANVPALADSALRARDHDLRLLEVSEDTSTLEIFLVDSRDDMKRLSGQIWAGWAQTGEKTAFFVAGPGRRPAFRHELMHAYSLLMWGEPPSGPWISEGLATWATGACQGKGFDALVAGFAQTDYLYPLPVLVDRFREIPEVRGYLQAASIIETIYRARGIAGVREIWQRPKNPGDHPLDPVGAPLEALWRVRLATATPAFLDTVALRETGC